MNKGDTTRTIFDETTLNVIDLKGRSNDPKLTEEERAEARRQLKQFQEEATRKLRTIKNGKKGGEE